MRDSKYWSGAGDSQNYAVAVGISDATWFHWSFVANSGTAKYYINGAEVDSYAYTGAGLQDTDANVIGALNNVGSIGYFSASAIDEICVSLAARSAAWIKATYHSLWDSFITFS